MSHMIFALLVSSERICAYTSDMPVAGAVIGSATNIKQHSKYVQIQPTLPPQTHRALAQPECLLSRVYPAPECAAHGPGVGCQPASARRFAKRNPGRDRRRFFVVLP